MNVVCRRSFRCLVLCVMLGVFVAPTFQRAEAQLGTRIKDRVKREAERRVEDRAVAAARRTLDLAEDAIVCAVTDERCIKEARDNGTEPVIVDEDGKPISGYESAGDTDDASGTPGEGVWANYDFVSGDDVLFYHDFEGTRTGNFPARLDYVAGNMEVVELGENKALRTTAGYGCVKIPLGQPFPERYTVEFRVRTSDPLARVGVYLFSGEHELIHGCRYPPDPQVFVTGYQGGGLKWEGGEATAQTDKALVVDTWADVHIAVDGPYWKVYLNERRVANVPRLDFPAASSFNLMFGVYREDIYVDEIRVAEGGPRSLYDDLENAGFVSTTAIRFDTGSAALRPESTGMLNEVLAMMQDHEDLRLLVEGHTDDRGSDDFNKTLSEQRAEAVAAWLIDHGVDAGRLAAIGYGESQPAVDNSSPEKMAQNRRVVFRRQ